MAAKDKDVQHKMSRVTGQEERTGGDERKGEYIKTVIYEADNQRSGRMEMEEKVRSPSLSGVFLQPMPFFHVEFANMLNRCHVCWSEITLIGCSV